MQAILEQLSSFGVAAIILAEIAFAVAVWVALLWRPRHRTHRPHDCRSLGCPWLDERPTR